MGKTYTNIFQVYRDVELYQKVRVGDEITLADIQELSVSRWPWVVTNWQQIKKIFIEFSNGNDVLSNKINSLQSSVDSYNLGNKNINPFNNTGVFNNYFSLLNLFAVSQLNLNINEQNILNNKIQEMINFNIDDFKSMISFLKKTKAISFQNIGLGDTDADALYGLGEGKQKKQATIKDLEASKSLSSLIKVVQGYMYDLRLNQQKPPNLLFYSQSNIDPASEVILELGYLSSFSAPFEISLESMAKKYLGSEQRWYELATINKLQPPFIDETGKKYNLLSNGGPNNIIVSIDAVETVAVGTKINIGSYGAREETRVVERLIKNENNTAVIYLSGEQNINRFKFSEKAFVRVFAPGTTRRGEFILVPTVNASEINKKATPVNAALRLLPESSKQFGIDLARDYVTRDFTISSNGYFKPSFGLDAIRKTVLNLIRTQQGELPWHPTYGINSAIGEQFFGTTEESLIFGELIRDSVLKDPRFSNVLIKNIATTGTSLSLGLVVQISGQSGFIPLTYNS